MVTTFLRHLGPKRNCSIPDSRPCMPYDVTEWFPLRFSDHVYFLCMFKVACYSLYKICIHAKFSIQVSWVLLPDAIIPIMRSFLNYIGSELVYFIEMNTSYSVLSQNRVCLQSILQHSYVHKFKIVCIKIKCDSSTSLPADSNLNALEANRYWSFGRHLGLISICGMRIEQEYSFLRVTCEMPT